MAHFRYSSNPPLSIPFFSKSHFEYTKCRTNSIILTLSQNYQLTEDELLPFLAPSDNRHPFFYNIRDVPVSHSNYLTYDTHSIDKSLELPPPLGPQATRIPQIPSFDITSAISLQTTPSTFNGYVNTHIIGNPLPNLDPPPPPSLNNPITSQPSSSHSPHQFNVPSNSPPPKTNTTQPSLSQIHRPLPPFPLSLPTVLNTQPQAHSYQTPHKPLSANPHPPSFFPISRNLSSSSYDPFASLHPGFHNYPPSSFQPPNLPPNPLPLANST